MRHRWLLGSVSFRPTLGRSHQFGWPDSFVAEHVALTQFQAHALITLDGELAHAVKKLVTVAPIDALS